MSATAGQDEIELTMILATAHRDAIRAKVEDFGAAFKAQKAAADIVSALGALGDLVLAADALEAAAGEAAKKLRAHLATVMDRTGGTRIETASGTWSTADRPALVEIPDPKAVPDEFMKVEPRPDLRQIAAHLKAGLACNWATLNKDRGVTVRFTSKRS